MASLKVYTDGGARGNPGPAGCAYLIFKDGELIDFGAFYYEVKTNNQAEYLALSKACKAVLKLNFSDVVFHLDSELVVKQLNGEYKIKDAELRKLVANIQKDLDLITEYKIVHVLREKNKLADKLVNIALDVALSK